MIKPPWLKTFDNAKLIESWPKKDGKLFCQDKDCGVLDGPGVTLIVDHIVPRAKGGTDDLSNLQPLCETCNLKKGARPDKYWAKSFFFDLPLKTENLRYAQRDSAYDVIVDYADWFGRPISAINGVLYTYVAVVGAGKTLLAAVLPNAINRVRLMAHPAAPRVDKVLFLTKDRALRNQAALDLKEDLKRYGICAKAPRIHCLQDGKYLWDTAGIVAEQNDIVVACVQNLWQKNGVVHPLLQETLARYPLIIADEPHFAGEQVMQIVANARNSIVFGLTSSPIDSKGKPVPRFVLFSTYNYQDAAKYDRSVKFLTDNPDKFADIVATVTPQLTISTVGEQEKKTSGVADQHAPQLLPKHLVVKRMLEDLKNNDNRNKVFGYRVPAEHRQHYFEEAVFDLTFPKHALVLAEDKTSAYELRLIIQDYLEKNRALYPEDEGWNVEVVLSPDEAVEAFRPTNGYVPKELDENHPWLRWKRTGKFAEVESGTGNGARILVRCRIGREGLNNPFCGMVVLTHHIESVVEGVQGVFGRQIRAHQVGQRLPPDYLDKVQVITHEAFNNKPVLVASLKYLCNMEDCLKGLIDLKQLTEGHDLSDAQIINSSANLTGIQTFQIVTQIGAAKAAGKSPNEGVIQKILNPEGDPVLGASVHKAFVQAVENPEALKLAWKIHPVLKPLEVVRKEHPVEAVTESQVVDHIISHGFPPSTLESFKKGNADIRDAMFHAARERRKQLVPSDGDLRKPVELDVFRKEMQRRVRERLSSEYLSDQSAIPTAVAVAMKQLLGATGSVGKNSDYDDPKVLHLLIRRDSTEQIVGTAMWWLCRKGYCKTAGLGMNIGVEADSE